jgi:hypothetical protein
MDERARRIGETQTLFREVNDRIFRLDQRFGPPTTFEIVCECGNEHCFARIPIDRTAYGLVRADHAAFAVIPGHEIESVEAVIERHDRYNVVRSCPSA